MKFSELTPPPSSNSQSYLSEPLTEPTSFASLFERGIDPDVEKPDEINHWHSKVPEKLDEWPEVAEILDYQAKVRQRVREVYRRFEGRWERRLVRTLAMVSFFLFLLLRV